MQKNNNEQFSDNLEIDLNEYYRKLKNNYKLIVKITVGFVVLGIIYIFIMAKPIYQYTAMIRLPRDVTYSQANDFVSIIQDDIKPDDELEDKYNKITDAILLN